MERTRSIQEFRAERAEGNERILGAGIKELNRFFALDTGAYRDGEIPVVMKELMGLVGSMVLRCDDCISYHIDRSIAEGATRRQVIEAMNIALVIGGSIVIPHLRRAFEILDELAPDGPGPEAER